MHKKLNALFLSVGTKIRTCLQQHPVAARLLIRFGTRLFIAGIGIVIVLVSVLFGFFHTP